MKLKLSSLCLLLSLSALSVMRTPAEEAAKAAPKTEEEIKNEHFIACHRAVEMQVLVHLNSEVSFAQRYSRVARPRPEKYYATTITSNDTDGNVGFEIEFIDRRVVTFAAEKSPRVIIAAGKFDSKSSEVFLMDDQTGQLVAAAEHRLVKNAKPGKIDAATIQTVKP